MKGLRNAILTTVSLTILACWGGPGTAPIASAPEPTPVEHPGSASAPATPARAPGHGLLPLAVGHRWTWHLRERTGAGLRIFGFATRKPTDAHTAIWTLSIESESDGRFQAELTRVPSDEQALPTTTAIELWHRDGQVWMDAGRGERPAIEARIPPHPVSTERVRCVANVLGGVAGSCAPLAGGPLGTAPGLHDGVVGADVREGAEVAQFLVGIATVGMFIPGNTSRVETAELVDFTPAQGQETAFTATADPVVDGFREARSTPGATRHLGTLMRTHGATAERAAAALTMVDPPRMAEVAIELLELLAPPDRYPVSRVAIQRGPSERLCTLARLRTSLDRTIPDAEAQALLALFEIADDRATAEILISGESDLLLDIVADIEEPFDSAVLEAMYAGLEAYEAQPSDLLPVVRLCTFDPCKVEVADRLLEQIDPAEHPALILAVLEALGFDDGRLQLLTSHAPKLSGLSASEQERVIATFDFRKDDARALLGG